MNDHIVKAYDEDLKVLHGLIRHMGDLTIEQVEKAIEAALKRNKNLAQEVIEHDQDINLLETRVDELAVRILALRQPVASDLRMVVAALKISNQIERIADYAANIAKRALILNQLPPFSATERLSDFVQIPKSMLEKVLTAFATNDVYLALHVWRMDRQVDDLYTAYLRHLFDMMIADPKNINPCMQLLFIVKNIERVGDQATNIAEAVYTMVTAKPFKESDPLKNDPEI